MIPRLGRRHSSLYPPGPVRHRIMSEITKPIPRTCRASSTVIYFNVQSGEVATGFLVSASICLDLNYLIIYVLYLTFSFVTGTRASTRPYLDKFVGTLRGRCFRTHR